MTAPSGKHREVVDLKMHRKASAILALILFAISGSVVFASFQDSVSVKNRIALGDVNISLREYKRQSQKEYAYQNPKTVLPGDLISKIPRITNEASPCWIRVSLTFSGMETDEHRLSEENLRGMTEDWVKRGEYFYYTKILEQNDTVDVFTGVKIPEEWDSSYAQKTTDLSVHAQAIQAANFTPDFGAMSPWGNEEIEKCVHEKSGARTCKNEPMKLRVEFEKDAHRLLAVPGDFFHNFDTLMPGDVQKDFITLSNTTEHPAALYFHTEQEMLTKDQKELLEQMSLSIRMNGQALYSGNLAGEALSKPTLLGEFGSDEEGRMDFEIAVPAALKNTYALRNAQVIWVFSLEENEDGLSEKAALESKDATALSESVKTADESAPAQDLLLLLAAVLTMLGAAWIWRGGNRIEK